MRTGRHEAGSPEMVLQRTDTRRPGVNNDRHHTGILEPILEYPIFITRQEGSGYRGWLPDFPGVDVKGGSYGELANAATTGSTRCMTNTRASSPPRQRTWRHCRHRASTTARASGGSSILPGRRPVRCWSCYAAKELVDTIDAVAKSRHISREALVAECTKGIGVPASRSSCHELVLA